MVGQRDVCLGFQYTYMVSCFPEFSVGMNMLTVGLSSAS